eukprot:TRINITY_DN52048_c0_g1_i1.p2 TRINITY_DN52048_c0_g1~~TRINITY_DN52048_c0_g1_i1.p2  ORF type:complete len:116 (-),score=1.01 TRINITY_DN52048_c0_g1_i1:3-350(-)
MLWRPACQASRSAFQALRFAFQASSCIHRRTIFAKGRSTCCPVSLLVSAKQTLEPPPTILVGAGTDTNRFAGRHRGDEHPRVFGVWRDGHGAVSYTHLTLPTKRIVEISVVAVSL